MTIKQSEFYDTLYRRALYLEKERSKAIIRMHQLSLSKAKADEIAMARGLIILLNDMISIVCTLIAPVGDNLN